MFILSKIVGFFLDPFIWMILALLTGIVTRNTLIRRRAYRWALCIFLIFSNPWLIKTLWYRYQAKPSEMTKGEHYSAGILLGGFVSYDEVEKRAYFNEVSDRFIQAARLYKMGYIDRILISGGNALFVKDGHFSEAAFVTQNLVDLGIPEKDILTEKRSKNTIENAHYSEMMLDSAHVEGPYVLITSAIHMPRALKIYEREGIPTRPYPCHFLVTAQDIEWSWRSFVPGSGTFNLWTAFLRELFGTLSFRWLQHKA